MASDAAAWGQALLNGTVPALVVGALGFGGVMATIRSQNKNLEKTIEGQERQRRLDRVVDALEALDDETGTALLMLDATGATTADKRNAALAVLGHVNRVARYADILGARYGAITLEATEALVSGIRALKDPDSESPEPDDVLAVPLAALSLIAARWPMEGDLPEDWNSMEELVRGHWMGNLPGGVNLTPPPAQSDQ